MVREGIGEMGGRGHQKGELTTFKTRPSRLTADDHLRLLSHVSVVSPPFRSQAHCFSLQTAKARPEATSSRDQDGVS